MPLSLSPREKLVTKRLNRIKKNSGSHSPSPAELASVGISVKQDFCYLSNPYATDLFLKYFKKDSKNREWLHSLVEHYPSQNRALAAKLTRIAGVPKENIFVGNGATEIIQAVLQTFTRKKILVPVPTFSPYLEFTPTGVKVVEHKLSKRSSYNLDLTLLMADVKRERPDTVVIVNPSNPDGGYIGIRKLRTFLGKLRGVETIIVDESFIHFTGRKVDSVRSLVRKYPNLIVIKSLSKDFGIAGLRLGYGVMSEERVSELLKKGFLWNISGFGEYFLSLLNRGDFMRAYENTRLRAIREREAFFSGLSKINGIKVTPSKANFFLVELLGGITANDIATRLLSVHGIYVRTCYDKVGLKGEYIRIASRGRKENRLFLSALNSL